MARGTYLRHNIIVELEYNSTCFLTCNIDIEEDVTDVSHCMSAVTPAVVDKTREPWPRGKCGESGESGTYGSSCFSTSSFFSATLLIVISSLVLR